MLTFTLGKVQGVFTTLYHQYIIFIQRYIIM